MMRDMIAAAQRSISDDMHKVETLESVIKPMLERRVTGEMHRLQMLGQRVSALDPDLLLKRGYSITLHEGKIVHDASQLKHGDKIEKHEWKKARYILSWIVKNEMTEKCSTSINNKQNEIRRST